VALRISVSSVGRLWVTHVSALALPASLRP
jgi:hypothetical protein